MTISRVTALIVAGLVATACGDAGDAAVPAGAEQAENTDAGADLEGDVTTADGRPEGLDASIPLPATFLASLSTREGTTHNLIGTVRGTDPRTALQPLRDDLVATGWRAELFESDGQVLGMLASRDEETYEVQVTVVDEEEGTIGLILVIRPA